MQYRLKEAKKKAKKSQMQAALHLGTTQMQISKYETGKQDLTFSRAIMLADYYNVTLDYLAGREEKER